MSTEEKVEFDANNPGGLDVGLIGVVGVAGSILLLVTILATTAWFKHRQQVALEETQYRQVPYERAQYEKTQNQRLNSEGWNEDGRTARIPLGEAVKLYVKQENARP